jgi:hypothetical protein
LSSLFLRPSQGNEKDESQEWGEPFSATCETCSWVTEHVQCTAAVLSGISTS